MESFTGNVLATWDKKKTVQENYFTYFNIYFMLQSFYQFSIFINTIYRSIHPEVFLVKGVL